MSAKMKKTPAKKKKKAKKLTAHEKVMAKLRHPGRWPNFLAWQNAMARKYGKSMTDWPAWAHPHLRSHYDRF